MTTIIENIASWALRLISTTGYTGLFVTMMLESTGIPIPSEIVLPFSGFLASTGKFSLLLVIVVTSLANLAGSLIFFAVGNYGGTRLLRKYGHLLLIHEEEIVRMENWLQRHGGKVAFFSRIMPGVRTYSSLVIGAGKTKVSVFVFYTVLGSVLWNTVWGYLGFYAGSRWEVFQPYVRKFDFLIIAAIVIFIIIFLIKHFHKQKK